MFFSKAREQKRQEQERMAKEYQARLQREQEEKARAEQAAVQTFRSNGFVQNILSEFFRLVENDIQKLERPNTQEKLRTQWRVYVGPEVIRIGYSGVYDPETARSWEGISKDYRFSEARLPNLNPQQMFHMMQALHAEICSRICSVIDAMPIEDYEKNISSENNRGRNMFANEKPQDYVMLYTYTAKNKNFQPLQSW